MKRSELEAAVLAAAKAKWPDHENQWLSMRSSVHKAECSVLDSGGRIMLTAGGDTTQSVLRKMLKALQPPEKPALLPVGTKVVLRGEISAVDEANTRMIYRVSFFPGRATWVGKDDLVPDDGIHRLKPGDVVEVNGERRWICRCPSATKVTNPTTLSCCPLCREDRPESAESKTALGAP